MNFTVCLSDATFYDLINIICQFIKPFFDKKCLFFKNMEPLKSKCLHVSLYSYIIKTF